MQAQRIPLPDEIAAGCQEIQSQPGWQRQHGGPRLLLAALIGQSAASMEEWAAVRDRPDEFSGVKYLECYAEARRAVAWVWSDEPLPPKAMQLSFLQVCDFLDLNPVATREQFVRRFSFECLNALGVDEFEQTATPPSMRSQTRVAIVTEPHEPVRPEPQAGALSETLVAGSTAQSSDGLQNTTLHTMEIPGSHFDTKACIQSMTPIVA